MAPVKARRELRVESIAEPISHYTDAVVYGDLVYVSGCVGSDRSGQIQIGRASCRERV